MPVGCPGPAGPPGRHPPGQDPGPCVPGELGFTSPVNRPLLCPSGWAWRLAGIPSICQKPCGPHRWQAGQLPQGTGLQGHSQAVRGSETQVPTGVQPRLFFQSTQWIPSTTSGERGPQWWPVTLSRHLPALGLDAWMRGWAGAQQPLTIHTTLCLVGGGWARMLGEMTLSPSVLCPDLLHAHSHSEHLSANKKHRHLLLTTGPCGGNATGMHFICFLWSPQSLESSVLPPSLTTHSSQPFLRLQSPDCISPLSTFSPYFSVDQ